MVDVEGLKRAVAQINAGVYPSERPGDTPSAFTSSRAGGDPGALATLDTGLYPTRNVADGLGVEVSGSREVWERTLHAVETGRLWRARWRYVRTANAQDPENDAVLSLIQYYDRNRAALGDPVQVEAFTPSAQSGPHELLDFIGLSGITGVGIVVPANAVYFRLGFRAYGVEARTVLTDLHAADVSDIDDAIRRLVPDDALPNLSARIDGLVTALAAEVLRSTQIDEAQADDILAEIARAGAAEVALDTKVSAEVVRATAADATHDQRLDARPLKTAVAGSPLLAPGIASLVRDEATGLPIFAITNEGEPLGGGKRMLAPWGGAQSDINLRVMFGTMGGRLTIGPRSHGVMLSPHAYAEAGAGARATQIVTGDGALIQGPWEHRALLSPVRSAEAGAGSQATRMVRGDGAIVQGPQEYRALLSPARSAEAGAGSQAAKMVRGDGAIIQGPQEYRALLAPSDHAEVDPSGRIRRGSAGGRMINGPVDYRPSLSRWGGHVDAQGTPIAVCDQRGVDLVASSFRAWVANGQAFIHVLGATTQVTGGTEYAYVHAEVRGGEFVLIRGDNAIWATPISGGRPALDASVTTDIYSDTYGQSNAAANSSGDVIHAKPFLARYLMFNGGQRAYGTALGHSQERTFPQIPINDAIQDYALGCEQLVYAAGETSNSGFAYGVLNRTDLPGTAALITTCSAVGSANMSMLRPDATAAPSEINLPGQPWRNLEERFRRARMLSPFQGRQFYAGPLRWNQGEGDIANLKASHYALLGAIRGGWQALAQRFNALWPTTGLGGFAGKAPLIVAQTCSGNRYVINGIDYVRSQVPWAQLQINLDDPTTALCLGPTYDQPYAGDGVHLLSAGQEMQGARQAAAWNAWLRGERWMPLHVRKDAGFAPTRSGRTVTLNIYNHFGLPLVFDTTTITGLGPDQGFRWGDDGNGNAVTVTAAAIGATVGQNTPVTLTLSADPTGTGPAIEIGMTGTPGASAGPATGNRATLRTTGSGIFTDSVFAAPRAVEHFVCIDRVPVI